MDKKECLICGKQEKMKGNEVTCSKVCSNRYRHIYKIVYGRFFEKTHNRRNA